MFGEKTYELACLAQAELLELQVGEYQMEEVAFDLVVLARKSISILFLGLFRRGGYEHPFGTYQGIQMAEEKLLARP